MKYLVLSILTLTLLSDPGKIGKVNSLKNEARKAYAAGDYKTAIQKYKYLVDSLNVNEDEVLLNLASAYYLSKDTANAQLNYQAVADSEKNAVRSKAQQQLGVMADRQGKLEEALDRFKQAIKADPTNDDARYNYELLKKKLDEKKKKEQEQQNKDQKKDQKKDQNKDQQKKEQEKKDQQNKDQKDQQEKKDQQNKDQQKKDDKSKEEKGKEEKDKDQQKKDEQQKDDQSDKEKEKQKSEQEQQQQNDKENKDKKDDPKNMNAEKLKEMGLNPEAAERVLDAMKNQEKQYLQQNKRKATKPKDRGKPDW
jgi:Ca-activated chloride channel family protein